MSSKHDLQESLLIARLAILSDPDHMVKPYYRQAIYQALGSIRDPAGLRRRAILAVITARHVLPLWTQALPSDAAPARLLQAAEDVINGTLDSSIAQNEAGVGFEHVEQLGNDLAMPDGYFAGCAAVEALFETLGRDPFAGVILDERTTDCDLDQWSSDTAIWAMMAVADLGGSGRADRRKVFWTWWLEQVEHSSDNQIN